MEAAASDSEIDKGHPGTQVWGELHLLDVRKQAERVNEGEDRRSEEG